jgi:glutaredoxin 3
MNSLPSLTLYHHSLCGPCQKVITLLDQLGVRDRVLIRNISEGKEVQQALEKAGGKVQVPCLVIGESALYESEEIMEWVKLNLTSN